MRWLPENGSSFTPALLVYFPLLNASCPKDRNRFLVQEKLLWDLVPSVSRSCYFPGELNFFFFNDRFTRLLLIHLRYRTLICKEFEEYHQAEVLCGRG